jgi:threonine synthase
MHRDIYAVSISDEITEKTVKEVWLNHKLLIEPHGAAGWAGLDNYFSLNPHDSGHLSICLETAHPAKFPEVIRKLLDIDPELPPSLLGLDKLEESYDKIENNYNAFKSYLLRRFRY